jgi:hypothetical protein
MADRPPTKKQLKSDAEAAALKAFVESRGGVYLDARHINASRDPGSALADLIKNHNAAARKPAGEET